MASRRLARALLLACALALPCCGRGGSSSGEKAPPAPGAARAIEGFALLGKNSQGYGEYRHNLTGAVFVLLPGGTFPMGSPAEEAERSEREGPVHEVTLSPFLIAKCETTQGLWEKVMGTNPSAFKHGPEHPVERVSWKDCRAFCAKTGLRLPTEAQWEFACRAKTTTPFAFGATITTEQANHDGAFPYGGAAKGPCRSTTVPADSFEPNGFGLRNMHGNLWEWCEDVFDIYFYEKAEARGPDPLSTSGSGNRVFRGGGYDTAAVGCRSAYRQWGKPENGSIDRGFRPAFYPLALH